ncbi:hypothetical protein N7509_007703 [Penicillium cosmopolitanum]|uniref:Uncharacterized protein n=1 Tax=Penicillium cosmopolitanum TaxID=1131564 RepID=A0A9X0B8P8_9EURO|nr:uncharacterized protein N7509_007703 [Penicillium cosmopolitanum]KAJ5392213.1 hypothetical protein N7509_007703 [Penicillium cosmopolitanum]
MNEYPHHNGRALGQPNSNSALIPDVAVARAMAWHGMAKYVATRPAMSSHRLQSRRHEDETDRHG